MKKQIIARLLVLAMLLAMVPASALAASAGTNAGSNEGSGSTGRPSPDTSALTLDVSGGGRRSVDAGRTLTLSADAYVRQGGWDYTDLYTFTYDWYIGNNAVGTYTSTYSFRETYTGTYTVTCRVTATPMSNSSLAGTRTLYDSTTWTIDVYQGADFSVSGYVNNDTERYYLGDIQDKYGDSIIDQIDAWLTRNDRTYGSYDDAAFKVTSSSDGKGRLTPVTTMRDLDDAATSVYFYLTSALTSSELSYSGKSTFEFTADVTPNYRGASTYSVNISITVDDNATTSSGDISYTAAIGDEVYFDVGDFEDFYHDKTNGGTLKYVSFDTVSGGTLYCSDGKLGSKDCYVNPTNRQVALDGVYFTTTTKQAKTVKIGFTAYGSKSSRSGTVTITYLSGEVFYKIQNLLYN